MMIQALSTHAPLAPGLFPIAVSELVVLSKRLVTDVKVFASFAWKVYHVKAAATSVHELDLLRHLLLFPFVSLIYTHAT
jgi:hypothetical protein